MTWEAQPTLDYSTLVELICSQDFPSESHAFFFLLSLRSKSLLWWLEKQKYSFRELGMYPSSSRANLSDIFLRTKSKGQSKYSKEKMFNLKSTVLN